MWSHYFHILISIPANLYLMRTLDVSQALRMIQDLLETKNIVDSVRSRLRLVYILFPEGEIQEFAKAAES